MDPIQNQAPIAPSAPIKKSSGAIIGIIIILVLVAVAALYFISKGTSAVTEVQSNSQSQAIDNTEPITNVAVPTVSTSDEVNAIDADLNAGTGADVDFDTSDLDSSL